MSFAYPLTGLVTVFVLIVYLGMTVMVGRARKRHNIPAPQTSGPDDFLRVIRVHENTVEGLVLFLPALWLFALTVQDGWAALVGVFYPIGRIVYARGYYAAAEKRELGFLIGAVSSMILLAGSLVALLMGVFSAA